MDYKMEDLSRSNSISFHRIRLGKCGKRANIFYFFFLFMTAGIRKRSPGGLSRMAIHSIRIDVTEINVYRLFGLNKS